MTATRESHTHVLANGQPKRPFRRAREAIQFAADNGLEGTVRIYRCADCGYWHLATKRTGR